MGGELRDHSALDILLEKVPPATAPLRDRLSWMGRLIHSVRPRATFGDGRIARLSHVLKSLDQNPELKGRVTDCLSSLVRDTRALELFTSVGIPSQRGFFGELVERVFLRILPQALEDQDLISVFSENFRFKNDPRWIRRMDASLFRGWMWLFQGSEVRSHTLEKDIRDAVFLLGQSVSAIGLSKLVRSRVEVKDIAELPFYDLSKRISEFLDAPDPASKTLAYRRLQESLGACTLVLKQVHAHFRDHGVSISLVYQVEQLGAMMRRLRTLARIVETHDSDPRLVQEFFATLVEENYHARRIRGLINDNIGLVCLKIVETNAETGEHYISRDREEHWRIFRSAAGGGVLTALTTMVKLLLHHIDVAPFVSGFFISVNYAVSFVGIQLCGFTLGTKQPAMTATALAEKLDDTSKGLDPLIDEIVHMLRSQITSVIGNILAVVPAMMVVYFIFSMAGRTMADTVYAKKVIDSLSITGMTPYFAAWTGVLLWASSVFSGLFANWFNFRGLPDAIEHHPQLAFVIGKERTHKIADFLRRNVAGFAASISLGFLLGMSGPIGAFLGIPLEIRHVTLSSGTLMACALSIGPSIFSDQSFWLAVAGIGSMAVLNMAVSFALALTVAIWAKKATAPSLILVLMSLAARLASAPKDLFFPADPVVDQAADF